MRASSNLLLLLRKALKRCLYKKSQFTIIWQSQTQEIPPKNSPCLQKPAERLNPSRPAAIVACRQKGQ